MKSARPYSKSNDLIIQVRLPLLSDISLHNENQMIQWVLTEFVGGTAGSRYYIDHAENCDVMEEDSVDRLWLVVRSLKSPKEGKYVSHACH